MTARGMLLLVARERPLPYLFNRPTDFIGLAVIRPVKLRRNQTCIPQELHGLRFLPCLHELADKLFKTAASLAPDEFDVHLALAPILGRRLWRFGAVGRLLPPPIFTDGMRGVIGA